MKSVSELNWMLDDAVNRAEVEEVRKLLDQGADVNAPDSLGETPLMNAAWVGSVEVVLLLLERGASLTDVNREGETALKKTKSLACKSPDHEAVISLLEQAMDNLNRSNSN